MTFTNLAFFLLLGLTFALHWSFRGRRVRNSVLLAASFIFYSWWDWRFAGLLLYSSTLDFCVSLGLERAGERGRRRLRLALLALSLLNNFGLLCFFKYFNFFIESAARALAALGWSPGLPVLNIILPVGISFYTFQTVGYLLDVYAGRLKPTHSYLDFLTFVSFFPQLVAGPIGRGAQLLPQIAGERRFEYAAAADGGRQFLWGLFKKVILADRLALIVDPCYTGYTDATGPQLIVATVCFALQIYFDFSAYSDMALGTARLFGIRLMRNFACPYFSQNVGEFWRRWHVSLSTWFRDYVYIPLGGSRGGRLKNARNVLATFLLSGLWHGAAWHFVAWGGLHGLGVLPAVAGWTAKGLKTEDVPGGEGGRAVLRALPRMALTFAAVCLAWVFFRAPDVGAAWAILRRCALEGVQFSGYAQSYHDCGPEKRLSLLLALAALLLEWFTRRHPHPLQLDRWPAALRWLLYTAVFWSIFMLSPPMIGQFVYFQF